MELPIAPESYQPPKSALVRAVKRSKVILSRTVATESEIDGATCFTNDARPKVRMANHAMDVRLDEGDTPDVMLGRITSHFTEQNLTCFTMQCADDDWPDALRSPIEARGYAPKTWHIYQLDRYTRPDKLNGELQIIPIRAAYPEARRFFRQEAVAESHADDELADQLSDARIDELDEPRLEMFMARLNHESVAVGGVLTLGQIGVIHNVYTSPDHRGKGVARTLMAHIIDHCERALFEQVLVERSDGCWAIPFYESLGFRRVVSFTQYRLPSS